MSRYESYITQLEHQLASVDATELARLMRAGTPPLVVDVRQPEEHALGAVPGSINLPRPKLEAQIEARLRTPDQAVVVYCGGRGRSQLACQSLDAMGLRASYLRGGWAAWAGS